MTESARLTVDGPTALQGATRLRRLIAEPGLILIPECLSAITARVVEDLGFAATYCGGNAMGTFHHAIPDYGVLSPSEMAGHVAAIVASADIPVIVDADQGGETVANVYRAVQVLQRAGAAAMHIEDSVNPKHSRVINSLVPIVEMQERLKAAVEAKLTPDFVVIARCEGLFNKRVYGEGPAVEEIIERGVAYAESGADVFMPICMDPNDIDRIASVVPVPVFDINHSLEAVKETALKAIIYSGWAGPSAVRVHRELATQLLETGDISRAAYEFGDRERLIDAAGYDAVLGDWALSTGREALEPGRSLRAYS